MQKWLQMPAFGGRAALSRRPAVVGAFVGTIAEMPKTSMISMSESWGVKYDKAVECLTKDRDTLLAFYDFPAEHWKHLRTTNVIESSFATVRHRTVRSKGCLSNKTRHDLQARRGRREKLAPPRWPQPVAESHLGCKVC